MPVGRPEIPASIKRQLRTEAGFGCCVCGNPVFQYHHIREYSAVPEHDPCHMMVLCPNHHHQATVGALTETMQRRWKDSPANVRSGFVEGLLRVSQPGVAVRIGSVDFVGSGFKFRVDDDVLVALDQSIEGDLELSVDVYDRNDALLITIIKNEWITGDPMPWDFEFGHRWLKLRNSNRKISLRIDCRSNPLEITGELWKKGQRFELGKSHIRFDGVVENVRVSDLSFVGMDFVANTQEGTLEMVPDSKYHQWTIVSWPERDERLRRSFDALSRLEMKSTTKK